MSRVLVIAPHPDDEVLGCGGAIINHVRAGRSVHVVFLTMGERGSPAGSAEQVAATRESEAIEAAQVLGIPKENLMLCHFPDCGIDARDPAQVGEVTRTLRQLRPTLLYIPHPADGSFDHQQASTLCLRAAGMAGSRNFPEWGDQPWWVPTILGYEVWTPIADPQYTEDITHVMDHKIAALGRYRSQTGKGVAYTGGAARYLPGYRGAMSTGGYREAFQVLRLGQVVNP